MRCQDAVFQSSLSLLNSVGIDYNSISERLVFNSSVTTVGVPVSILDDMIAEDWETFILHLSPEEGTSDVDVAPNRAYITIADDDSMYIHSGLILVSYRVYVDVLSEVS